MLIAAEMVSARGGDGPSILDLVRLSPRPLYPSGGPGLYRQIAGLTRLEEGEDVLVTPCGAGLSLELLAREWGVQGSGADPDGELVDQARRRTSEAELQSRLQFEVAPAHDLPYRDDVFDLVVGELGLTRDGDPAEAVRELVRVTRPGGRVALAQPVWKTTVEPARRDRVSRQLGVRPLLLTEWKDLLRSAGVKNLHSESWSEAGPGGPGTPAHPIPAFADYFTVREKVGVLRRAWNRWGVRGAYEALVREADAHRTLGREDLVGLGLILGRKAEAPVVTETAAAPWEGPRGAGPQPSPGGDPF